MKNDAITDKILTIHCLSLVFPIAVCPFGQPTQCRTLPEYCVGSLTSHRINRRTFKDVLVTFRLKRSKENDNEIFSELIKSSLNPRRFLQYALSISIHLIPKWPPFKYSFVFIQISPWCLVLKLKIQKNILSWTRQQGPICVRINQRPVWNKVYRQRSMYHYIITQVNHGFWLVLAYDLLEDRRTIDVTISFYANNVYQWHTRLSPRVPLFCSYHILTSSVIYYWTDARQHGIYLLNIHTWLRGFTVNLNRVLFKNLPWDLWDKENRSKPWNLTIKPRSRARILIYRTQPILCLKGVVSNETVVLRRWGSSIQKFGFIKGVANINWPPYRDYKS